MAKIVRLQSCVVDESPPPQVKDMCPYLRVTTSEEDSDSTNSSDSRSESLLHDNGDAESDNSPEEEAVKR